MEALISNITFTFNVELPYLISGTGTNFFVGWHLHVREKIKVLHISAYSGFNIFLHVPCFLFHCYVSMYCNLSKKPNLMCMCPFFFFFLEQVAMVTIIKIINLHWFLQTTVYPNLKKKNSEKERENTKEKYNMSFEKVTFWLTISVYFLYLNSKLTSN